MGACNIEFDIPKKATWSEIQERFKRQREQDRIENGQRSYTGDFQTVDKVVDYTNNVFNSYNEAHEFCMQKAEKWISVVAVYYKDIKIKPNKQIEKLGKKLTQLVNEYEASQLLTVKLPKFVTCEGCSSRVSTSHTRGYECPVCGEGDFRPLGLQRKLAKLKAKIELLKEKRSGLITALKTKQAAKQGDKDLKTLVAGLGAC
jgi:hypothetical protein